MMFGNVIPASLESVDKELSDWMRTHRSIVFMDVFDGYKAQVSVLLPSGRTASASIHVSAQRIATVPPRMVIDTICTMLMMQMVDTLRNDVT